MGLGGKRPGAGRKPVADEQKVRNLCTVALRKITGKEDDDEAKVEFLVKFSEHKEGMKFIAEHVFGKPKEIKEITGANGGALSFSPITFVDES